MLEDEFEHNVNMESHFELQMSFNIKKCHLKANSYSCKSHEYMKI